MNSKLERINELVKKLNEASRAYYQGEKEIMSNFEYDAFYDELVELEKENIELVKSIKEDFFKQISNIKKAKKVLNAYEPNTLNSVSTFEVNLDD